MQTINRLNVNLIIRIRLFCNEMSYFCFRKVFPLDKGTTAVCVPHISSKHTPHLQLSEHCGAHMMTSSLSGLCQRTGRASTTKEQLILSNKEYNNMGLPQT